MDANGIAISTAPEDQEAPAVASTGEGFMVVWRDWRDAMVFFRSDIYGTIVLNDGTVVTPAGNVIASVGAINERAPDIAASSTNYLVVWRTQGPDQIFGRRYAASGAVQDLASFQITSERSAREPTVNFDGYEFTVAWLRPISFPKYALMVQRVSTGSALPSMSSISQASLQPSEGEVLALASLKTGEVLAISETLAKTVRTTGQFMKFGAIFEEILKTAQGIHIKWRGEPGREYQFEFSNSIVGGEWTPIGAPMIAIQSGNIAIDPIPFDPQRFYRIVQR
jgi:hypothetical protein